MNLLAQYRTWLEEEIRQSKRDDEGSPTLPGLTLALYQLRLLIDSRPAVLAGHCGIVSIVPPNAAVCWQDEGHDGPHDQPA